MVNPKTQFAEMRSLFVRDDTRMMQHSSDQPAIRLLSRVKIQRKGSQIEIHELRFNGSHIFLSIAEWKISAGVGQYGFQCLLWGSEIHKWLKMWQVQYTAHPNPLQNFATGYKDAGIARADAM